MDKYRFGEVLESLMANEYSQIFALAPFAGPSIGPIVSGFITVGEVVSCHYFDIMNEVSDINNQADIWYQEWRWVFWILTIFAGICFLIIVFFVPETYAPAILMEKAKRLRKETGDDRWYAPRTSAHLPRKV